MAETEKIKNPKKKRPASLCNYVKMWVMQDLSSKTVIGIVQNSLSPDSRVKTDNYTSYRRLNAIVKKPIAKIVPSEEAGKELPWFHITISNSKRNLLNCYHHVDDIFLQNYLDEFTYKLNRSYFGEKIFDRLIIACSQFSWAALVYDYGYSLS